MNFKWLPALALATQLQTQASLVDLTPGGFTPSIDGSGNPPAYTQVFDNYNFGAAFSSSLGQGPYNGLGGIYLFSDLYETNSTTAQVSWNLTDQQDQDWLTYIRVFGEENGIGLENIYKVDSQKLSGPQTITINDSAKIYVIQFWGRNPTYSTIPESGSTLTMLFLGVLALFYHDKKTTR